jgi:hypothetical protein
MYHVRMKMPSQTGHERPEMKTSLEGQNEGVYSLCADAQTPSLGQKNEK